MLSQGERVSTDPVLLIRLVLAGLPSTDAENCRLGAATNTTIKNKASYYRKITLNTKNFQTEN
jgi:hypothetical protein